MVFSLLRLLAVLAVLGGVVALGIRLGGSDDRDDAGAAVLAEPTVPAGPTAPVASSVLLTQEDGVSVVHYILTAADALVIHFSSDDMASCDFTIIIGPREGAKGAEPGIEVDYLVVPADEWEPTVRRMGRACDEYWYSGE